MERVPPPVCRMLREAYNKAREAEADHRLLVASLEGQLAVAKKQLKEYDQAIKYIEELNATQPILQPPR